MDLFVFLPNKRREVMDLLKESLLPASQVSGKYTEFLSEHKRVVLNHDLLKILKDDIELFDPEDDKSHKT